MQALVSQKLRPMRGKGFHISNFKSVLSFSQEYPIKTHCEAFYSLRKALGIQANNLHSIAIDGNSYRNNTFIVGIDTDKLLGLSFTGMNTRNNLMTVHLKTQTGDYQADRMHIVLLAEQIVELGDTGSMVYD